MKFCEILWFRMKISCMNEFFKLSWHPPNLGGLYKKILIYHGIIDEIMWDVMIQNENTRHELLFLNMSPTPLPVKGAI